MKNKALSLTANSVPYIKELRPLAGSIAACIVMQQLDYWFARRPAGFFKFLAPCDHESYRPGDSWCEELNVTPDEFRAAFDKIGTRHTSKGAFDKAEDKFAGRFYCSYHDKIRGVTFYYRNHDLLDAELDRLFSSISVTGKSQLRDSVAGNPLPPNWQKPATEMAKASYGAGNTHSDISGAETTSETTAYITQKPHQEHRVPEPSPAPSVDVIVFHGNMDEGSESPTRLLEAMGISTADSGDIIGAYKAELVSEVASSARTRKLTREAANPAAYFAAICQKKKAARELEPKLVPARRVVSAPRASLAPPQAALAPRHVPVFDSDSAYAAMSDSDREALDEEKWARAMRDNPAPIRARIEAASKSQEPAEKMVRGLLIIARNALLSEREAGTVVARKMVDIETRPTLDDPLPSR